MAGFLALYSETDRVELRGGYYVDIRKYLDHAAWGYAQRKLVDPRLESTLGQKTEGGEAETRTVASMVDQQAYNLELLVAAIVDWNLTDEQDRPLPLPPYIPPTKLDGEDKANLVRRDSIRRLPAFATKKILDRILKHEKDGADDSAPFPEPGEGAPDEA